MKKKKVFVSFDFDNDQRHRYLLGALAKSPRFRFDSEDRIPLDTQGTEVEQIKAGLTQRIQDATHTLVIVGAFANSDHLDCEEIGAANWQHWEVDRSLEANNRLVVVRIDAANEPPPMLLNQGAAWAVSFKVDAICRAIEIA